jgi:hypothetical protein
LPDGSPLTAGVVEFDSVTDDPKRHAVARGKVEPDGTFRLSTYREGDGAVEGRHRVVVMPAPVLAEDMRPGQPPPRPNVHPRFGNYETSGLEVTVKPGRNEVTLTVEGP